jgi:hypothetical protein
MGALHFTRPTSIIRSAHGWVLVFHSLKFQAAQIQGAKFRSRLGRQLEQSGA